MDGARTATVAYVRRVGDIHLLKSYLLLVWTDRCLFHSNHIHELESLIREEFGGIEMEHHRKDLIERLDRVLGNLGPPKVETVWVRRVRAQYTGFKDPLLEADARWISLPVSLPIYFFSTCG
jgi:hypothetical protein